MLALKLIIAQVKRNELQHFCMAFPEFVRLYGFFPFPNGARL
ncbi:hypothetical protein HNR26_003848 [Rhizobium rosettiformans]|uniref:Uncharacterized protein n=1 Tax=Rhizobium rosettiformans TaxID=1368430 RepID=A0A7W8HT05_9HYPH|nr:hypothetical protein [Rhizobium rosettiformans]MBB5277759.1 hypothetical protein [Rhizobium rosettiformans]